MDGRGAPPHVCQVAFSVPNVLPELRLCAGVLGYQPAGFRLVGGPLLARLQELQDPVCLLMWLSGGEPFFQLEFFQYAEPASRPKPPGWRACDIGYNVLSFAVADVTAAVAGAVAAGTALRGGPTEAGGAKRACVESPAGILVELVEAPTAAAPARLCAVRASTPDLARSRRFFVEALGFIEEAAAAEDSVATREALWGLPGAQRRLLSLASANGVRLELAEYATPRPAPRPDGYRLSDSGVMNLALGYRDRDQFHASYHAVVDHGYWVSNAPRFDDREEFDVVYIKDDQGFSVELLFCPESRDAALGFSARAPAARLRA